MFRNIPKFKITQPKSQFERANVSKSESEKKSPSKILSKKMFRQKVILHRLRGAKKIANIFAFSAYAGRRPLKSNLIPSPVPLQR